MIVIGLLAKDVTHTHPKTKPEAGTILTMLEPLKNWYLSNVYLDYFYILFFEISYIDPNFYC